MVIYHELMFQVSTKAQYALGALQVLATTPGQYVSVKTLASRKRYPLSYLQEVLTPLKAARLVESKEGSGGGYRLAKPARQITLLSVLEAIDGPLIPVKCVDPLSHCPKEKFCGSRTVWQEATEQLKKFFTVKTVADIAGPLPVALTTAECKI